MEHGNVSLHGPSAKPFLNFKPGSMHEITLRVKVLTVGLRQQYGNAPPSSDEKAKLAPYIEMEVMGEEKGKETKDETASQSLRKKIKPAERMR